MIASPNTNATTAPTARNTPNGTSRFFLMDNGMKISEPSAAPAKTVSSTPRHPTKLPTIAIIFTSPPPIASSLNTHVPAIPTSHSSTNPTAAQREQEADDQAAPGEFIRNDVVACVGDRDPEQQRAEQGGREGVPGHTVDQQRDAEQHAHQCFDERVLLRDRLVAPAALAAQPQPRKERNVVAPRDRLLAVGARRARTQQRLVARQPQNADVEEAAHAEADQHGRDDDHGISAHAAPRTAGCLPRRRRSTTRRRARAESRPVAPRWR